jgi:hypothetical protein
MMSCDEYRAHIAADLLGELGDDERGTLESHLAGCADCRTQAERTRAVWRELGTVRMPVWSDARRALALDHLRSAASAVSRPAWPRRWAWAASLVLAFATGTLAPTVWLRARAIGTETPQYLLLLAAPPRPRLPEAADRAVVDEYRRWAASLAARGQLVSAQRLRNGAGMVLTAQGNAAYVPGDSEIGGFFLIRAASEAEALAIARRSPHLKYGGTVVVRPVDPT